MGERNLYGQGLNWTVVFRHLTTILCRKSVPIMWKIVYSKFNFTCYSPNHLCFAYLIITNSIFLLLWLFFLFVFFFNRENLRLHQQSWLQQNIWVQTLSTMPQVCGWKTQPVPPFTFVFENYRIMMVYMKISLWYMFSPLKIHLFGVC